jgi:hypothetical protein
MICLSVSNDFDGKELLSNKLFDRNVCGCRVAEIPGSCLEHFESALRICEKKNQHLSTLILHSFNQSVLELLIIWLWNTDTLCKCKPQWLCTPYLKQPKCLTSTSKSVNMKAYSL